MLQSLLVDSLERISSLQHFYELENENIDKVATEGMRINCLGYLADRYFSMLTYIKSEDEEVEQLKKRLENFVEVMETNADEGSVIYRLKGVDHLKQAGYELDIKKASLQYRQYADMPVIHGSNTLIMLITRFEEFISNFMSDLYIMFPQKYLDKQSVTFSELSSSNIKDVKQLIIDRQLDSIMRDSYKEWFKIFESHKLSFKNYSDEMRILEEIYARRNILVHNSGRVNESYLALVKDSPYKIGEVLAVDKEYLANAFDAINILIFAIIIEAVKLIKTDKNEYLQSVFTVIFDSLCAKKYKLCGKVYNALLNSKELDALHKTMSTINYWICCIELNGLDSVKKEIESYDVSALAPIFDLAKNILLEDYECVMPILDVLYNKSDVNSHMLENWPLFMRFRKSAQYTAFKDRHAEDFNVATFELTTENAPPVIGDSILTADDSGDNCACLPNDKSSEQKMMAPV